jgi:hypothetical protein
MNPLDRVSRGPEPPLAFFALFKGAAIDRKAVHSSTAIGSSLSDKSASNTIFSWIIKRSQMRREGCAFPPEFSKLLLFLQRFSVMSSTGTRIQAQF